MSCVVRECLSKPDYSFTDALFCARLEVLISVLKMVFQAVKAVLPKFRMGLLGLHLKSLAGLDRIVLPILNDHPWPLKDVGVY